MSRGIPGLPAQALNEVILPLARAFTSAVRSPTPGTWDLGPGTYIS